MRRKRKTGYVSEFAQFMDGFLEHHPEIADDRQRGRGLYWDKKVDIADLEGARKNDVPVDGYYYFGKP